MHPLSGSDLATLVKVLGTSGGIPPKKWLDVAAICGAVLGRAPLSAIERLRFDKKINELQFAAPPIFILGHWRSGTTHLYNIMSKGNFGFLPPVATGIPWDMLQLGTWLAPQLENALPSSRFIDNIPVLPDSPQEDEIALANMTDISYYHGLYFPKRLEHHLNRGVFFDTCSDRQIAAWQKTFLYFLKKVALYQDNRQMLVKNPVYTARPSMMKRIVPDAKFVHISRNPYEVFESMRNFYRKLFAELALQEYAEIDVDRIILSTYSRMMDSLNAQTKEMDANTYLDIRYEDLTANPLEQLARIYDALNIPGFDDTKPRFETYLSSVTTYKKNTYTYTDEAASLVETHWRTYLEAGGYRRPGAAV